jgi:hypothetical protein
MTNTYFNLKQGDRVELKHEFDRGRFKVGHRGTVQYVSNWLGKNHVKVSVLFDGDNAAYEFSPQTGGVLRRLISLEDPLDTFIEELLDIARENPVDDARLIIRDRLLKDAEKIITRNKCDQPWQPVTVIATGNSAAEGGEDQAGAGER